MKIALRILLNKVTAHELDQAYAAASSTMILKTYSPHTS